MQGVKQRKKGLIAKSRKMEKIQLLGAKERKDSSCKRTRGGGELVANLKEDGCKRPVQRRNLIKRVKVEE